MDGFETIRTCFADFEDDFEADFEVGFIRVVVVVVVDMIAITRPRLC